MRTFIQTMLVVIAAVTTCLCVRADDYEEVDDIKWYYSVTNGETTITDIWSSMDANSLGLLEIGDNAFNMCHDLETVALPGGQQVLGSVTNIGGSAFLYSPKLLNVAIGRGVMKIGSGLGELYVDALTNETLFSLYAALPPTWHVKEEAEAKRYFLLFKRMLGATVHAAQIARGYADVIIETKKAVYMFEFKFNKSAKAAIRQIREKGYVYAYKPDRCLVTLTGINFSSTKRNIDEPLIESL